MKMVSKPFLAAVCAATLVSACSPIVLAPAGPYRVGSGPSVALDRPWNDITAIWMNRPPKARLLSLDGPALNRLYLTEGLSDGDAIARRQRKEEHAPVYAQTMSVSEQVELIAESVTALGYQRVTTSGVRPVSLGEERAVRFDIDASTADGLTIKGIGQAMKRDGKLFVAIYLAPAEHYFEASRVSAEHAMATLAN